MSESLLNSILENKESTQLGGEKRYATVLMSDLRGFSSMSEKHKPEVVVDILNTYLEIMIDIIHKHDGFINEILGDGILVVFGVVGILFSIRDLRLYKKPKQLKKGWLKFHLGKMIGGYISATTAFVVVNQFFPGIYGWFVPGIIGSFVIVFWIKKIERKTLIN